MNERVSGRENIFNLIIPCWIAFLTENWFAAFFREKTKSWIGSHQIFFNFAMTLHQFREALTKFYWQLMKVLWTGQSKSVPVTYFTDAFITCCMKRAKIFWGDYTNPHLSSCRRSPISRQEIISNIKKNCFKLYLLMNRLLLIHFWKWNISNWLISIWCPKHWLCGQRNGFQKGVKQIPVYRFHSPLARLRHRLLWRFLLTWWWFMVK